MDLKKITDILVEVIFDEVISCPAFALDLFIRYNKK
jgi:hypothetical protein